MLQQISFKDINLRVSNFHNNDFSHLCQDYQIDTTLRVLPSRRGGGGTWPSPVCLLGVKLWNTLEIIILHENTFIYLFSNCRKFHCYRNFFFFSRYIYNLNYYWGVDTCFTIKDLQIMNHLKRSHWSQFKIVYTHIFDGFQRNIFSSKKYPGNVPFQAI